MFTKKQTNGFFDSIRKAGLNAADFSISKGDFVTIAYNSLYAFKVTPHESNGRMVLRNEYKPDNSGVITIDRYRPGGSVATWEETYGIFAQWLKYIKEEEETPDLWAEAAAAAKLFDDTTAPDEKFTNDEIRELQAQLRAAEARVAASGLPEAAIKELTAVLRESAAKADTMSKKDWFILLFATIAPIIYGLSVEHIEAIKAILSTTFGSWLQISGGH